MYICKLDLCADQSYANNLHHKRFAFRGYTQLPVSLLRIEHVNYSI